MCVIDAGSSYFDSLTKVLGSDPAIDVICRMAVDARFASYLSTFADPPDVVMIDAHELVTRQAEIDDLYRFVRDTFPQAHILIFDDADQTDPERPNAAAPAVALVTKGTRPGDVASTMRFLTQYGIPLLRGDVRAEVKRLRNAGSPPRFLTPREKEILQKLSRGEYVTSIARDLGISVHTARGHVKNALAKLSSHTQLEAVAKAIREGWISVDV